MILLVLFAFVAGAGTALSPCVLPVLPALLSAGATGGRRRPLGIILGLLVTFTFTVVALASLIDGVGLADGAVRALAVVVLIAFGLSLVVPRLGELVERPLARLARLGPSGRGDGFRSGLVVGAALGFVYAPCAGPILAAVISVAATRGASLELVAIAFSYGVGSALVLLLLASGGRRLADRVRRAGRGPHLQRALGVVMVLTAVLIATELDVRFQTALASDLPGFVTNPTRSIERSGAVEDRLADLRGKPRFSSRAGPPSSLPALGRAPEFTGTGRWFNTPGGRPLSIAGLHGRVVLIDFWTYTCINCIRTLPYVREWADRYRSRGLTVVGVHTPEFSFERRADNVRRAVARNRLSYPVAQDNRYGTWSAWGNQYWPAKYLIDANGQVRYTHFGEGDYGATEAAIRSLLAEAGAKRIGERARVRAEAAPEELQTPETYLGSDKAERFAGRPPTDGTRAYRAPRSLPQSYFALGGVWKVDRESATAVRGATIDADFVARKAFLVLSSRGERPRRVRVEVNGRPTATVTVSRERLYRLVDLGRPGQARLRLRLDPGVTGYAFTFG